MDPAVAWPDFRESWIVAEDADLVVIDKPVGVSSQAADPTVPDDIVSRLKAFLEARGDDAYLGVHQRLDRDTSGLLVYARRRSANAKLAAQFEGRRVEKTYVASVAGWARGRDRAVLRDSLARGVEGRMRVVRAGSPGAQQAVTRVRVLARRANRALLELSLETGRTHQARVQLAHAGAPIAGDVLYEGPPAARLMLHAAGLSFDHPEGRRVRYDAPPPPELATWLEHGDRGAEVYDDLEALRRTLDRAMERRWALGRSAGARATNAFRLVNEEGDGLPRLAVDAYGGWLVAQLYGSDGPWAEPARRDRVLDALASLGFDGVYLKVRPKQANVIVDSRREDLAPRTPVRGAAAPEDLSVVEEGMPLLVKLGDGLSTGVFLDQRANRRRLRDAAAGTSVANLFAYTCAFTVAAAIGGAKRTVSVDVSAAALERGRANLAHAGVLEGGDHAFVAEDVFAWLARAARRGQVFDWVVLDPPSYSTTRRGRFVADEDYTALAASALALVAPGGRLLACTNHRGISASRFRRILFDAGRAAGRELDQVKDTPVGVDFPAGPAAEPHMKSVVVAVAVGEAKRGSVTGRRP